MATHSLTSFPAHDSPHFSSILGNSCITSPMTMSFVAYTYVCTITVIILPPHNLTSRSANHSAQPVASVRPTYPFRQTVRRPSQVRPPPPPPPSQLSLQMNGCWRSLLPCPAYPHPGTPWHPDHLYCHTCTLLTQSWSLLYIIITGPIFSVTLLSLLIHTYRYTYFINKV